MHMMARVRHKKTTDNESAGETSKWLRSHASRERFSYELKTKFCQQIVERKGRECAQIERR